MQSRELRKEAIRKFKERKPPLGVFAVRCSATDRAWVGVSRNLNAEKNGCWFVLRIGSHLEKSLQQEWDTHGESAFEFEILEQFDEDLHPLEVSDLLKAKKAEWIARLHAQPLP